MDMVSLITGGPSLPAFSPVQWHWWPPRQKGSFKRWPDLLHGRLSKSWSLSIWTLLETIFRWTMMLWKTLGACACGVGVRAGKYSAEKGKRTDTTCLGNCWFAFIFPVCPLPFSTHSEHSGDSELGRTLGMQNMQQACGLWWAWICLGIFHSCSMVSMSGRYRD